MIKVKSQRLQPPPNDEWKTKFPHIGEFKNTNTIVLFIDKNIGIVLSSDYMYEVGYYADNWHDDYVKYVGVITIQNDF